MGRPLVLIESPFAHNKEWGKALHLAYLEGALLDSIRRGECPIATHKLYTRCLDDTREDERKLGMEMLLTLLEKTDYHAVYCDLGISGGMMWGARHANAHGKHVEVRSLYERPVDWAYREMGLRKDVQDTDFINRPKVERPEFDTDFYINKWEGPRER